jgi:hypothetical protein
MQIKKVYISGPITGYPDGNRPAFLSAQKAIIHSGHIPLNPHVIGAHLPALSSWVAYMRVCIAALTEADEIVMLPGWVWSRGARVEWLVARVLKIKVRYLGRKG